MPRAPERQRLKFSRSDKSSQMPWPLEHMPPFGPAAYLVDARKTPHTLSLELQGPCSPEQLVFCSPQSSQCSLDEKERRKGYRGRGAGDSLLVDLNYSTETVWEVSWCLASSCHAHTLYEWGKQKCENTLTSLKQRTCLLSSPSTRISWCLNDIFSSLCNKAWPSQSDTKTRCTYVSAYSPFPHKCCQW